MSADEPEPTAQTYSSTYQTKLAVHERDMYRCACCWEVFENPNQLDVDHIVPRGQGGADTMSQKISLCRRCHKAKDGRRAHAPTARFISTGDMIEKDFTWFRHLWMKQLPALTEAVVGYRVTPKFGLTDDGKAWHIPLGDLRRLDRALAKCDSVRYQQKQDHSRIDW